MSGPAGGRGEEPVPAAAGSAGGAEPPEAVQPGSAAQRDGQPAADDHGIQ